ncbi:MAG: histidine phosphatase family protein [Acidimicrobiales bacterium]
MGLLMIMRHGKSDWNAGAMTDHERPLNQRGVDAATRMGEVLTRAGLVPDRIIASSATRTASTAQLAARAGGWKAQVETTDVLYGATPDAVIRVIKAVPDSVGRLLIVGHEPTSSGLIGELTGAMVQVKTATVAALAVADDWDEVDQWRAEIVTVLQPRHFTS